MTFPLLPQNGINPPIMAFLKDIAEGDFAYTHYGLRHPGAIYNLMTTRLITDINILVNNLQSEQESNDIYNDFRVVLYDLFKFYDSCFEIMLCFCPPIQAPQRFIDRWLEKNGFAVAKDFKDALDNDVKFLKNLYNTLKHTSNEVRYMIIGNDITYSVGYYLEVPTGPTGVKSLPDYPISFNYEIRRIAYIIYKMSDELLTSLQTHIQAHHGRTLSPSAEKIDDHYFQALTGMANSRPSFYLPIEIGKLAYHSKVDKGEPFDSLEFYQEEITSDILAEHYSGALRCKMVGSGDGFTREFSRPHGGIIDHAGKSVIDLGGGVFNEITMQP